LRGHKEGGISASSRHRYGAITSVNLWSPSTRRHVVGEVMFGMQNKIHDHWYIIWWSYCTLSIRSLDLMLEQWPSRPTAMSRSGNKFVL